MLKMCPKINISFHETLTKEHRTVLKIIKDFGEMYQAYKLSLKVYIDSYYLKGIYLLHLKSVVLSLKHASIDDSKKNERKKLT